MALMLGHFALFPYILIWAPCFTVQSQSPLRRQNHLVFRWQCLEPAGCLGPSGSVVAVAVAIVAVAAFARKHEPPLVVCMPICLRIHLECYH